MTQLRRSSRPIPTCLLGTAFHKGRQVGGTKASPGLFRGRAMEFAIDPAEPPGYGTVYCIPLRLV